jgi:hypothetical protein
MAGRLYCSAVRRRSWLFWAFVAVVLAGTVIYLPAELARRATATREPVSFLSHPAEGWRFVLDVAGHADAAAGTPSEARSLALHTFDDGHVRPAAVELLWLPDRHVRLSTMQGTRDLATNTRLVWNVTGRVGASDRLVSVGLIDFASGKVIYDGRLAER